MYSEMKLDGGVLFVSIAVFRIFEGNRLGATGQLLGWGKKMEGVGRESPEITHV